MKAIITALGFVLLVSGCAGSFEKYFDQQQQSGYSEQDYYADDGYVVQEEIVQEPAVTYTPTEEKVAMGACKLRLCAHRRGR